jgi:hypothetical protein
MRDRGTREELRTALSRLIPNHGLRSASVRPVATQKSEACQQGQHDDLGFGARHLRLFRLGRGEVTFASYSGGLTASHQKTSRDRFSMRIGPFAGFRSEE